MRKEQVEPVLALRKETPPPKGHFGGRMRAAEKYADVLEKIATEPGEWFAMLDYGDRTSTAIATAKKLGEQRPDFEFVGRNGVVYARFPNGGA